MIPRLVENGGTDFFDALVSARDQLANSRIHRRHIILLTDGDTNRSSPDEYRNLIQRIAAENISVTTIRMGDNTVNLALLRQISEGTNGQFHYVEDAQMLPDLVLRDTSRAVRSTGSRGDEFYPQVRTQNQLLRGIEERNIPYYR
jgi:Ca-activated chloride channel family protein